MNGKSTENDSIFPCLVREENNKKVSDSESLLSVQNTSDCLDPKSNNYQIKAYAQTIDVWNMKYKQYPIWQNTLNHN